MHQCDQFNHAWLQAEAGKKYSSRNGGEQWRQLAAIAGPVLTPHMAAVRAMLVFASNHVPCLQDAKANHHGSGPSSLVLSAAHALRIHRVMLAGLPAHLPAGCQADNRGN